MERTPVVLRYRGFRFFFYSDEGVPPELIHIHVGKDGLEAKFRVVPKVSVAYVGMICRINGLGWLKGLLQGREGKRQVSPREYRQLALIQV
jgi:hypothetical protein